MAETFEIEAISGSEIINDFTDQIARKMSLDCNLRASDSYALGYSGTAQISLRLFGMDTAEIEIEVRITKGDTKGEPNAEVEVDVVVAHEPDLELVRSRSEQPTPTMEHSEEPTQPVQQKRRRYNKALPQAAAPSGGAEDVVLE